MLNENKVKMMTKMAIYEKNEGKKMIRTARYFKSDFIAFGVLKTLIATTIAYLIVIMMYVLCNAEGLINEINTLDFIGLAKKMGTYYGILIGVFTLISIIVYNVQYDNTRKGLKKYFSRLNKLERFYNGQKK